MRAYLKLYFELIYNSSALYGVIFKKSEEAAFSNYRLWESAGFLFAYVLQTTVSAFESI